MGDIYKTHLRVHEIGKFVSSQAHICGKLVRPYQSRLIGGSLPRPRVSLSRGGLIPRQFCVPPVAQNVHSTRRTVVTVGPDDQRSNLFVKTMPERAKGSTLDITSTLLDRVSTLKLLSPHAQQFRTINVVHGSWPGVREFSKAASGPLPLLNTLKIDVVWSKLPMGR